MRELELLRIVSELLGDENVPVPAGAHDAAIVEIAGELIALSCDTVNEVSDFPPGMKPEEYGHMAAAVAFSDLAACCAKPLFLLNSISMREADVDLFRSVLRGMKTLAAKYGAKVVGGDLDFSPILVISTFAVGRCSRTITRSGARPGEKVFLTGVTGKAELCLRMLKSGVSREDLPFADKLYTPEPRIREGLAIAEYVGAATDVSDSLAISLHAIAESSGVKVIVDVDAVDLSELEEYDKNAVELFLYGGGDFELLFTADSSDVGIEIGRVEEGSGVFARIGGKTVEVEKKGYQHF